MGNYNRIADISDHPKIDKLYQHWYKLARATADKWPNTTWPALFKTDAHKRRVIRRDKMAERFCRQVRKELNITDWSVKKLPDGMTIFWREE